ncbi:MFS transporter [Streptosporangium sp. KLBMP 9127]|nr:MFS transporter [Streptosporangium sp. KLBMP 9127]
MPVKRPSGFPAFVVIWFGQVMSTLGTRMTNFALSIWAWQMTGHATDLALMTFCAFLSTALFSPIAGSLIDRWNRRLIVVLSDLGSVLTTMIVLGLLFTGSAQVWHLYLVNLLTGIFLAFQAPAYGATISLMMEKGHFPKANAMMSLSQSVPAIFAPSVAGTLLLVTDLKVVLFLDLLTYLVAIGTVFLVAMPQRPQGEGETGTGMWRDSLYGFRYILRRPGLLGLQSVVLSIMLLGLMGWTLLIPMIMARTGDDSTTVGIVQSVGAVGGVAGAILISVLRPTERKMTRILLGIVVFSLFGRILLGLGDSVLVWAIGWLCAWSALPIITGYGQAIWQQKVDPAVQGRVFAARSLMENLATPIALGLAGPLADFVLEPAMNDGGALAGVFGGLVGTGPGAGMALIFVVTGVLGLGVAVAGFAVRTIRDVEATVPDHDTVMPETALTHN